MQPPNESITHQQHKISEFVVNGRTIRAPAAPPPTYRDATNPAVANKDQTTYTEDEEDDEEYCLTPPPITIDIDATTRVDGHWNSVPFPTNHTVVPMVINALKHVGVLGDKEDQRRAINIKINASTTIRGNSNKMCPPLQLMKKNVSEDPATPCSRTAPQPETRKRRAYSVSWINERQEDVGHVLTMMSGAIGLYRV